MPRRIPPITLSAKDVWEYATRILTSLATPADIVKFVGKGSGTEIPANTSLYDVLTNLAKFIAKGSGTEVPANKSLYDILGLEGLKIMEHELEFPSAEVLDDIAVIGAQVTTECPITVALPTGAAIRRVLLVGVLTAMNNTANAQKIDVTVQGRKGAGGWSNFFSETDCIGLGAVDGATTQLVTMQDVSALVDAATAYGFRLTINQNAAQSVRYTSQYLLVVTYRMS